MEDRYALQRESYVVSCSTMLEKNFASQSESARQALLYCVYPQLVSERPNQAGLTRLEDAGLSVNYRFPDGGTLLHHYLKATQKHSSEAYLRFLLERKVDVNAKDR